MTPTTLPPSRRGPGCPPAAALEALSAGEQVPPPVADHAGRCTDCAAQVAALRAEREAWNRARPPERFLRQLERREAAAPRRAGLGRLWPALALAVPLALAAALAPGLLGGGGGRDGGVTLRGGAFRVAVARAGGGAPELLERDAVVRAGDALRFAYEADRGGHLLVIELDGRGRATVLHPFGAAASAPLPAGERAFLPGSVVLDDAPGPTQLVAVFSERPIAAAPLLDALAHQAGRPEPALACDGCEVTFLRLRKAP